ncbi:F-box protein SKIP23 [Medicago truncatula]|uniref:F-box protein SKIP23 n=1 Tax=Medicago truncatula TaxID=3880 RepID=UPI001967D16A|nr:F-box protein SKIP23-like [Medicago truncatula]
MKKKTERKENQSSTADWSALPMELVSLISQFIDNEIDLIRFRSICSNWRSSSIPNHHLQTSPIKFPLVYDSGNYHSSEKEIIDSLNNTNSPLCYLSKRTLVLVKPPQHGKTLIRRRPWLIRVTQNSHGKTKFFNPVISYRRPQEQTPIPPHVLDFNKLSILYLGTDFIIDEDKYPKTVLAVMCHGKNPLLLCRLSHCSNRPMMIFRGLNEQEYLRGQPVRRDSYGWTRLERRVSSSTFGSWYSWVE